MQFYPAIDLKDGDCVRLLRGEMDQATVFSDNPGAQAAKFADQGATYLHVVDLNGAFAGKPVNAEAVRAILANVSIPVQLGGGIRTMETVEFWLNEGISRVILGTIALTNPELVKEACASFPGRVAIGLDTRDGFVATEGWADVSDMSAENLGQMYKDAGAAAIIHTDIGRDGAMEGPNLQGSLDLAEAVSLPVIVSGGISSMADVSEVALRGKNLLDGAISGRAVYDGKVNVQKATQILAEADGA